MACLDAVQRLLGIWSMSFLRYLGFPLQPSRHSQSIIDLIVQFLVVVQIIDHYCQTEVCLDKMS